MIDPATGLTILGMTFVTAFTRIFGYWAVGYLNVKGRLKGALNAVPGSILIAIVAPAAFSAGPAEAIAGAVTVGLAWRFPMLVAVSGGVGCVVVLRYLFG